jgi:hypothetical protein
MSAMIGFAVGVVVGIGATMIALVVIDDWKEEKKNEKDYRGDL